MISSLCPSRNLGSVSRALLPLCVGRPFPLVTLLAAYFDDSRNSNILTIAGYSTAVEHWDASFAPAWAAFRDDPSWPSPISEYKAADCRCGHHEFASWSYPERDRCTRQAVQIIGSAFPPGDLFGYGIGVEMPPEWK